MPQAPDQLPDEFSKSQRKRDIAGLTDNWCENY